MTDTRISRKWFGEIACPLAVVPGCALASAVMALAGEVTDASRVRTETVQLGEIDVYVASPTAPDPTPPSSY